MAKLTEKERAGFEDIMKEDLSAIHVRLMNQIKDFWDIARRRVMAEKGFDKLEERKALLKRQINEMQAEIHDIEGRMNSGDLRPEQVVELGGNANDYGRYKGANFYGIPVTSQFEYEIVEYIRENVDLNVPAKFLHDLGRSCMRELAMSGTFEEAREAYQKFYSMDFKKYGVDIPPRLVDLKKQKEFLSSTKQVLQLSNGEGEACPHLEGQSPNIQTR